MIVDAGRGMNGALVPIDVQADTACRSICDIIYNNNCFKIAFAPYLETASVHHVNIDALGDNNHDSEIEK